MWTPKKEWQPRFVEALTTGVSIKAACRAAGVCRSLVYRDRSEDQDFAKAWDEAEDEGTDELEDEALRRALNGTDKPVFQGGEHVGVIREYSDTLTIFLLKGRRPEKYRERIDQNNTGSINVKIKHYTPGA